MKYCAHSYTGPCHWCDPGTPIREAAKAAWKIMVESAVHPDIDEIESAIKSELENAVPAKEVSNDLPGYLFHEALGHNECRKAFLGEAE